MRQLFECSMVHATGTATFQGPLADYQVEVQQIETASTVLWFQGIQLGRVLSEMDPSLADSEGWSGLTIEGAAAAFRPE